MVKFQKIGIQINVMTKKYLKLNNVMTSNLWETIIKKLSYKCLINDVSGLFEIKSTDENNT